MLLLGLGFFFFKVCVVLCNTIVNEKITFFTRFSDFWVLACWHSEISIVVEVISCISFPKSNFVGFPVDT